MCKLTNVLGLWVGLLWLSGAAWGGEYRLMDGTILQGEPASFTDDGLIVKLTVGQFSDRVSWIKFTQDSLKELAKDPKGTPFVEPFIEIPPEVIAKRKEIVVRKVERMDRPSELPSFFAAFTEPVGLAILGVLFAANLFAGYAVARFRNRPVALVCCVSAVLPIIGPSLFLALPELPEFTASAAAAEGEEEGSAGAEGAKTTSKLKSKVTSMFHKQGSSLALAHHQKATAATADFEPKVFNRSEFTLNRRFFETQFPGFFRVVPSESEKDLVLVFRCGRNEYVGKRITRIAMNDLHLQLQSGGEVQITFSEIGQITMRHKDHKEN